MNNIVKTEDNARYAAQNKRLDNAGMMEDDIIAQALTILNNRLHSRRLTTEGFTSADIVKNFLKLKIAELEHEVFGCLFLDTKLFLVADEIMFTGTINSSSVYPREVVKAALKANASSVIFYHNHPSGDPAPSVADRAITRKLKDSLALIDINALDHLIIGESVHSMAEFGEF